MTLSYKIAKVIIEKNIPVEKVVSVLQSYNLLSILPSVLENIKKIISIDSRKETLSIESPFLLSPLVVDHIKKIVGSGDVTHEFSLNKKILAGFKARYKGVLYDGSAERIIRQITK